jgi:hypothetical protein
MDESRYRSWVPPTWHTSSGGSAEAPRYIWYSDTPGAVFSTQGSSLVPEPMAVDMASPITVVVVVAPPVGWPPVQWWARPSMGQDLGGSIVMRKRWVTRSATQSAAAADGNERRVKGAFAELAAAKPGNVSSITTIA